MELSQIIGTANLRIRRDTKHFQVYMFDPVIESWGPVRKNKSSGCYVELHITHIMWSSPLCGVVAPNPYCISILGKFTAHNKAAALDALLIEMSEAESK